jgi:hypothetical protein
MTGLSRRQFLIKATTSAAGMIILTGCAPIITNLGVTPSSSPLPTTPIPFTATPVPKVSPSFTPLPVSTETLEPTGVPTATQVPTVSRANLMKHFPEVQSIVVHTHSTRIWNNNKLVPEVLAQMLDTSITRLTGLTDAIQAWKALFDPGEAIAIKVNTINEYAWTHVALATAVAERLQVAGIPPEHILIYDRTQDELKYAGYSLNQDGPGVRIAATDGSFTGGFTIVNTPIKLSNLLLK